VCNLCSLKGFFCASCAA